MKKNTLQRFFFFWTKPDIFFYALLWLMVLVVLGTVSQKYIGLYQAQHTYFSSFYFWLGPVPLPGGYTTLGVVSVNLLAKFIFASPWHWKKAGTIITHFGVLLLLLGGLLTSITSKEGSMLIYEGAESGHFDDYHAKELIVYTLDESGGEHKVVSYAWNQTEVGNVLTVPKAGFSLEILKRCRNCNAVNRENPEADPQYAQLQGRARKFDIEPIPPEKDNEKNKSGMFFRITGAGEKDGIHFSVDFIESAPFVEVNGVTYYIALRRARTYLPFNIRLIDFQKEYYPGTDIPHHYRSEVVVEEGDTEWRSLIQMNEPLRYRGYTFYQSSFIDNGRQQATVLAVVRNGGRMFPYIASITMCIGLLVHMVLYLPRLIQRRVT